MPAGGQLTVQSARKGLEWVRVSIIDTGIGIPKVNLEMIFEPLFTTKAKGMGLGLAIAKMRIDDHKGSIEVQSEPSKGSSFTIRLPTLMTGRAKLERRHGS
jgi:signal transduction histidine kinase